MSNQFHNRLVGTIAVVALGVIFLPDLLDGKNTQKEEGFTEIPLRPNFTDSGSKNEMLGTVDIPIEPKVEQPKTTKDEVQQIDKPQDKLVAKPSPKPKQEKPVSQPEIAYTIQLGSFNNAANVKALVAKLRNHGFTAYTVPKIPVDKHLTKVFVGPNISKSKLQKTLAEIDSLTKLKGKIVQFKPVGA